MNEPKAQQEPSMEEILASIRRIISEDGTPEGEKDAAAAEAPAEAVAAPVEAEPEPAVADDDAEVEDEAEDDVLELTEVVDEEGGDEPVDEAADALPGTPPAEVPEPAPAPPQPPQPAAPAPGAGAESALISAAAAGAAGAQLSSLVAAVDQAHGGTPIGAGNRTIEDLVKEVMRPMIKDWLDANLPGLVERIVRREVERLARRAEGDD